jgi:pimeloyl-ACP methyl ester carboxylesterase
MRPRRPTTRKLLGLKALVHDAVDKTVELVREGHESTSRAVLRVTDRIEPLAAPARTVDAIRRLGTDGVLGTIRVVNRGVEAATDVGLALAARAAAADEPHEPLEPAVPMRSDALGTGAVIADAAEALVNAVVGDHLVQRDNGLDVGMRLRAGDFYVPLERDALGRALPAPTGRVALFVHGLGTTEWCWCLEADHYHGDPTATFGSLLARDLGITPLYLRYNTGRHVSENGRALAALLASLRDAYPAPIDELVLIGHSMGGLVVRSACHYGREASAPWLGLVRRVFCLGAPHRGAPLEKVGNVLTGVLGAIDHPATLIPARVLEGRSAGIKDLRHGSLVDEDWLGRDPDALIDAPRTEVSLLDDVAYHFVSATVTEDPEHPLGRLIGDLLVRVPSASGPLQREEHFAIETARFGGVLHHQLQNHPAVYQVIRRALEPAKPSEGTANAPETLTKPSERPAKPSEAYSEASPGEDGAPGGGDAAGGSSAGGAG